MKLYIVIKRAFARLILLTIFSHAASAAENVTWEFETEYYTAVTEYKVVNAKVDPATFKGWNVFHNVCVGCHGVGGSGTDLAPDLTLTVEIMGPGRFYQKVLHRNVTGFSREDWYDMESSMFAEIMTQEIPDKDKSVKMPHWENNPVVRDNVHNIYRYLKARSDGAIGTGKPQILKE